MEEWQVVCPYNRRSLAFQGRGPLAQLVRAEDS